MGKDTQLTRHVLYGYFSDYRANRSPKEAPIRLRKSDRLFQLTNILRTHKLITAKELAEKLSVSERTIYRYIDDLSVSGIPVYGEAGRGYRLSDGFELPPLQLSPTEVEALVSGVNFVASLTGKHLTDSAHSLLSKIEAALPSQLIPADSRERTLRIPASLRGTAQFRIWDQLHGAIESKEWISITYQSASGTMTQRTVFPLGLFYWGAKWTMGSWCSLRSDYRDFRVDRLVAVTASDKSATLPAGVSLQAYIAKQEQKGY